MPEAKMLKISISTKSFPSSTGSLSFLHFSRLLQENRCEWGNFAPIFYIYKKLRLRLAVIYFLSIGNFPIKMM